LYPFSNARPSAEKSPVSDSDAPIVIGAPELLGAVPPLDVLPPLQAARTPAESTATALSAIACPENQGRAGRTPVPPSFPLRTRQFPAAGNVRVLLSAVILVYRSKGLHAG
jgi:hypothetical protein